MPHLLIEKGVFPTLPPLTTQNLTVQTSQKQHNNAVLLNLYTKKCSYVPYSGCVLDHILSTSLLTHNEKLFYLLADSLGFINGKNATKQRSIALSSLQWAQKLGCSKTEIFSLQKSLEEKSYFIIVRDTNKFGKTKRNIIIPTLPNKVFEQLYITADRFNLNPKDKQRISSPTYFSTLISNPLDPSEALDIQVTKRSYLDQTKLFIKINYQILNLITASKQLSPFAKILWLYFYSIGYKSRIKPSQCNDHHQPNDYFAFTASYQELQTLFACSRYTLSKTLNLLQSLDFISKNRFFVKNNNENDNLHDRSLWNITVSLPYQYLMKIPNIWPKPIKEFEANVAKSDPYCANSDPLLNKDFKINNNIKNLDNTDANPNIVEDFQNLQQYSQSLSKSYKNSIKPLSQPASCREFEGDEEGKITGSLSVCKDLSPNPLPQLPAQCELQKTSIVQFFPNRKLQDWYPLLQEDVDKLNSRSGREFSVNFVNELLLKLGNKYPDRLFPTKNHIISYMAAALHHELHQAPMVNHQTFRFIKNDEESMQERKREKYLSEVENSIDTSYESQLRRKIAAMFEPRLAYQLLTTVKFTTTGQKQRSANHSFDAQPLETKSTAIIPQKDALLDGVLYHRQTEITKNNQDHSFIVKLNQEISLSVLQQQILENSITAVYGRVDIAYQQLPNKYRKLEKLPPRQQEGAYLNELDHNSAWYKIRVLLKEQFGASVDKAWFSKLIAEENINTKEITLIAPTNFIKDYIRNNYQYKIQLLVRELGYYMVELMCKDQVQQVA